MTQETPAAAQAACTMKQWHKKNGIKETHVSCPSGEATYTEGKFPTLVLSSYGSSIGEQSKIELSFNPEKIRLFSKTVSGNETVRLSDRVGRLEFTSVYCEPSWFAGSRIDRLWEKTRNAALQPSQSILADEVQQYAKQHPQVVAEILKVKPVIGVSASGAFTLEQALAMNAPQFAACPTDAQSIKEGIVIQKRVRN